MAGTAYVAPQQKSPATEAEQDLFNVLRGLVGSLNGETAFQRLVRITGTDDADEYAVIVQNQGAGGHLRVPGIMDVTSSGVVIPVLSVTTLTTVDLNVSDDATIGDALTVTGVGTFNNSLVANGPLLAFGAVTLGDAVGDAVAINGATTMNADLTFNGARRILGDLSNATLASRLLAQSSTTNGASNVGVIPNGTSTQAGWEAFNNATPASATGQAVLRATNTAIEVRADSPATSYLPLDWYTNNTKQATLSTGGVLSLHSGRLQVIGTAAPSAGTGLELGAGIIVAFNRTGGTYQTLSIDASTTTLAASGTTRLTVASGGVTAAGTLTSTGGIVISGPNNIDGNGGTAGQLRIGTVIVNQAALSGSYKLEITGDFLFTGNGRVTGGIEVDGTFDHHGSAVAFYAVSPVAQQTVSGSRASGAALADLLTKLANTGLIVDGTGA